MFGARERGKRAARGGGRLTDCADPKLTRCDEIAGKMNPASLTLARKVFSIRKRNAERRTHCPMSSRKTASSAWTPSLSRAY